MKVARKLTAALIVAIVLVMAGYAWVQVQREVVLYERDRDPAKPRGRAFLATIQAVWRTDGEQRAHELVEEAASVVTDVDVRWTRTDAASGDAQHPFDLALANEAVATGELRHVVHTDDEGYVRRFIYLPMAVGSPIVIEATESLERQATFIRMSHRAIVGATVAIALLCGLITIWLGVRLVGRPIQLLRDHARALGRGDFTGRLHVRQRDEIGELADEMNVLSARLAEANRRVEEETEGKIAALEQLRHSDRLATVGQLASGIAHELGTPLSVVSARAGLIGSDDGSSPEVKEHARVVAEQASRMTEIIRQLLDFSRRRSPRLGVADVQHVVARTLDLLSSVAHRSRVTLDFTPDRARLLAPVDQNQLQQALANVVVNGIQAMPRGGRLTLRVGAERAHPPAGHGGGESDYLRVVVQDDGEGIPPENLAHIFEPFFTTKGVGEGTGLGLSVAHGIVAEHHGWIEVESTVGKGTRFSIFLPAVAAGGTASLSVAS